MLADPARRRSRSTLLNDLQATALGTLVLPADGVRGAAAGPRHPVDPARHDRRDRPGTGLGEALLVSDGARYRALPSEGGHADFAPGTDEEIELLAVPARPIHGAHVSYERVLSGAGIGDLYDFVRVSRGAPAPEPAWLRQIATGRSQRGDLARRARRPRSDAASARSRCSPQILGAEAGNLALRALATGGVVIGGGIPPKILPAAADRRAARAVQRQGALRPVDALAPRARRSLEPRAALLGAAHHAATHVATYAEKAP